MFGLVTMMPAVSSSMSAATVAGSSMPRSSEGTATARKPQSAAEAGLVPWAVSGMRILCRWLPRWRWQAWKMSMPVSSPWAPAAGCRLTASRPVILASMPCSSNSRRSAPWPSWSASMEWAAARAGVAAWRSLVRGLYFIVHEPSG